MFNNLIARYVRQNRSRLTEQAQLSGNEAQSAQDSGPPARVDSTADAAAHESNLNVSTPADDIATFDWTERFEGEEPILDDHISGATWNSLTCIWIHKLPDEVLVVILLSTRLRSWRDPHTVPDVNPIYYMRVCRRWRNVILTHGCFWDHIVVRKRTEGLQLALTRSHQMPLHFTFNDLPTLIQALPYTMPLCGRMQSLVLKRGSIGDPVATLSSLLQGTFPLLTKLVIQDDGCLHWTFFLADIARNDGLVFVPTNFPRLTHLELDRVQIQLDAPLLQRLTVLTLIQCPLSPSQQPADEFFEALQHAQQLEELVITHVLGAASSHHPSLSRPPFSLPRLRKLVLHDTVGWVRQFTTLVQFPSHGQVQLRGKLSDADIDNAGPITDYWELMTPRQFGGMPSVRQSSETSVHVGASSLSTLSYSGGPVKIVLQVGSYGVRTRLGPLSAAFATMRTLLYPTSLRSLRLTVRLRGATRTDFDLLFDRFSQLESLDISAPLLMLDQPRTDTLLPPCVLESLSTSPDAASGADDARARQARVRCPELKRLSISGYDWDDGVIMTTVIDCLRTRARLGAKLDNLKVRVKSHLNGEEWQDGRYEAQVRELISGRYWFSSE